MLWHSALTATVTAASRVKTPVSIQGSLYVLQLPAKTSEEHSKRPPEYIRDPRGVIGCYLWLSPIQAVVSITFSPLCQNFIFSLEKSYCEHPCGVHIGTSLESLFLTPISGLKWGNLRGRAWTVPSSTARTLKLKWKRGSGASTSQWRGVGGGK